MDQKLDKQAPPGQGAHQCKLPPRMIALRELTTAAEVCSRLLEGKSLNAFNHRIVSSLSRRIDTLAEASALGSDGSKAADEWKEIRPWFLFAISNQNFCSPAHLHQGTIFQGGAIRIPEYTKYLRSEINTSMFNGGYDRSVVVIRSGASGSFKNFASQYIAAVEAKEAREYPSDEPSLSRFLMRGTNQRYMTILPVSGQRGPRLVEQLKDFLLSANSIDFEGSVYLKVEGSIEPEACKELERLLRTQERKMQILVEEDYDPLDCPPSGMKRVTFIHNGIDPRRYQLIQDGASMGYRPALSDVIDYYLRSGRLGELLETANRTEDHIVPCENEDRAQRHGADIDERNRDYRVLTMTLDHCRESLGRLHPASALQLEMQTAAREEAESLRADLSTLLKKRAPEIREVSEVFHRSYYRLRTLVQYVAMLSECFDPREIGDLEKCIGDREGGLVIAANSGMAASRTVITSLAKEVGRAYSTPHYWETDFLIENVFGINPHYPEIRRSGEERLTLIGDDLDPTRIEEAVEKLVSENELFAGGQLVCADKSISPFFYTRVFDLEAFAAGLAQRSQELKNPVYLVVDNTLDFDSIYAESLFPNGIPRNVFLIFTPSQAKLHQLGFDAITGGAIHIHNHESQNNAAQRLAQSFASALSAEDCRQTRKNLHFLDCVFYRNYDLGEMTEYLDYMLRKRHRNTRELNSRIDACVAPHFEKTSEGRREYRQQDGSKLLLVEDPQDRNKGHSVEVSFHFEPASCIHSYVSIVEPEPAGTFIAGPIFEEMKRRIYKMAAGQGVYLADGTSWGFHVTRLDSYMHTLRIATGLEHRRNVARLGTIIGSVLKELVLHPGEFLRGVEVCNLDRKLTNGKADELLALDRLIPHDPADPVPLEYYLENKPGRYEFSFAVMHQQKLAAMLLAYVEQEAGEKTVYISKTATAPEFQGRGYFRRMLEHLKDRARAEGIDRVFLQTSASEKNDYVRKAYEKCGFRVTDMTAEMLPNGWPFILVRMELDLSAPVESPHFEAVPAEVYEAVYRRGDLEPFEGYRKTRFQE